MSTNSWPTTNLGVISDQVGGLLQTGPFGSQLHESDYSDEGVPVVMPKDIIEGRVNTTSIARILPHHVDRLSRHKLADGDIVYGRRGDIGRQALIRKTEQGWLCGTGCLRISLGRSVIEPEFLHYYLRQPSVIDWIAKKAVGATMPNLNTGILRSIPVHVPPLPVQRRIAGILSAYDELIENSQRRIRVLEHMARALYREWFVHFRFPGRKDTRPVVDLPDGWKRQSLEEVAEFRLGKMLDQEKNRGDLLPYLANVNVRWGEFDLRELREMRFEKDELETYGLKFGDIVMCEGGEPGRCAIWKEQIPGMMIQKAIHRIRCRENMDHIYLYHSLRLQGEFGQLASLFTGATIKHLPREKLAKVTVVVPPTPLLKKFGEAAKPMEAQIEMLQRQIQNLRRTRDLLLPRLLSGQVELSMA